MITLLGALLFALGIIISIALHEAGHLATAKAFRMKATEYFIGFGPRIWSFRKGETEYGLKVIPAGGYVKIVGMSPNEEIAPEDLDRAFIRQPAKRRAVVLAAGSTMHFCIALALVWVAALWTGLPTDRAVIGKVSPCVVVNWEVDEQGYLRECEASDPQAPAVAAGLLPRDRVTSVGGTPTPEYTDFTRAVRTAGAGPIEVAYVRDRQERQATVNLILAERPKPDATPPYEADELQSVSVMGVTMSVTERYGPLSAVPATVDMVGRMVQSTFQGIAAIPSKIGDLLESLAGAERDPEGLVSVVGAARVGGEAVDAGSALAFLLLLAGLNVFIGIFNMFPLPPLDGGHLAVLGYERVRARVRRRQGKPDLGPVDVEKLVPLTLVVIIVIGSLSLLTILADIINPIANPFE